jgi:hypothetical protein
MRRHDRERLGQRGFEFDLPRIGRRFREHLELLG